MILTPCPKCGAKCVRVTEGIDGRPVEFWACESDSDGDFNQSEDCRRSELEGLLAEILPMARRHSCGHPIEPGGGDSCCKWREMVARLEAAGIKESKGA